MLKTITPMLLVVLLSVALFSPQPPTACRLQGALDALGLLCEHCLWQCMPKCLRCPEPLRERGGIHSCALVLRLSQSPLFAFQLRKELFSIDPFTTTE